MHLIDTHTHLDAPEFSRDRRQVLDRAIAAGVQRMVVVGIACDHWQAQWQLVQSDCHLHAAFGVHPMYLDQHRSEQVEDLRQWLEQLAGDSRLCALGEFGLDYFIENPDRPLQQYWFEAQLKLAEAFQLPALLHVRRAHDVAIATLKRLAPSRGGIIHAFTGSYEQAREYMKLGFCIGLGGAPTWPQAHRLHRMVQALPLEAIVLETDSPDMAPAMHPNQRNTPANLVDIAQALATLRNMPLEELAAASTENACRLFGWDK